jgi:DNA-binding NarL/FixJ family response regulator
MTVPLEPATSLTPAAASTRVRVLLVGECPLVRSGFRQLLEGAPDIVVVASAADPFEVVALLRDLEVDVVVAGAVTREVGANDLREIVGCHPAVPVLILGQSADPRTIHAAFASGARGYMQVELAVEADLIQAVRALAAGERYLGPELLAAQLLAAEPQRALPPDADLATPEVPQPYHQLTGREKQVLTLVASGRTSREIATMLGLSANTVAVHRANLMKTLDVRKATGLVLFAVRHGLVTAD